jgi:hypothetical protein
VIVKGTKAQAEEIREECRAFLEGKLKLMLNMEKTHITHVNDGFVFLGHRIIRKRGSHGRMSVVTTIPKEKAKGFVRRLTETLSGNHSVSTVDMIAGLNRQLAGWAAFYKFTDFIIPLRVSEEQEEIGLDLSQHGEVMQGEMSVPAMPQVFAKTA